MKPHVSNWPANPVAPAAGTAKRIAVLLVLLVAQAVRAQTNPPATAPSSGAFKTDFLWGSATTNRLRLGAFVDYSYVAPGDVHYYGNRGESDAQSVNVMATAEIPLNEKWYVPVGLSSGNTWFNPVREAPIPDRFNTLHLGVGLGARINEQWTLSGSAGPVLYRFDDVQGNDVGFTATLRAVYRAQPNLTVSFGLVANPDGDIPLFPALGARWDIQTNLTLNLVFPKPGIIYRPTSKLSLFLGAGLNGATFRTGHDMSERTGLPQYNHALATYWDARVGTGIEYQVLRRLALSLEGGYSVGRQIDYKRIDEKVRFDPGPYVQAGLRYRF